MWGRARGEVGRCGASPVTPEVLKPPKRRKARPKAKAKRPKQAAKPALTSPVEPDGWRLALKEEYTKACGKGKSCATDHVITR